MARVFPTYFYCNVQPCNNRRVSASSWKRHCNSHDQSTYFTCKECGKICKQKAALQTHMNSHTGAKPHKCKICGSCFGDPASRSRHMKYVHWRGIDCPWPTCGATIKRNDSMTKHMKTKHGVDITPAEVNKRYVAREQALRAQTTDLDKSLSFSAAYSLHAEDESAFSQSVPSIIHSSIDIHSGGQFDSTFSMAPVAQPVPVHIIPPSLSGSDLSLTPGTLIYDPSALHVSYTFPTTTSSSTSSSSTPSLDLRTLRNSPSWSEPSEEPLPVVDSVFEPAAYTFDTFPTASYPQDFSIYDLPVLV